MILAVVLATLPSDPAALCARAIERWRVEDAACAAVRESSTLRLARVMREPECVRAVEAGRVVVEACQR